MTTTTPTGANLTMHVLDRHVELALWAESEEATVFFEGYLAAQVEAGRLSQPEAATNAPGAYADNVAEQLGLAETYWVSPDMVDLIEQAAPTVKREPLRLHHLPARHGFVQFARTIDLGVDEFDDPWGVDGVSWSRLDAAPKSHTTTWWDERGEEHRAPGALIVWWVDTTTDRHRRIYAEELRSLALPWAVPGHVSGWSFDLPWDPDAMTPIDRSRFTLDETGDLQRKLLLTTFQLLLDEMVVVWRGQAPRPAVRRAGRALKSPNYGDVQIVDLRKVNVVGRPEVEADEDAEPVWWSHRWVVREHWRTLHRGDAERERQVYVRRHVKGPPDRPLIVKDRLSRLIR